MASQLKICVRSVVFFAAFFKTPKKHTARHQLSMLKVRRQTVRRLKGKEKKQKTHNKIGTAKVTKSSSEKSFTWPFQQRAW